MYVDVPSSDGTESQSIVYCTAWPDRGYVAVPEPSEPEDASYSQDEELLWEEAPPWRGRRMRSWSCTRSFAFQLKYPCCALSCASH